MEMPLTPEQLVTPDECGRSSGIIGSPGVGSLHQRGERTQDSRPSNGVFGDGDRVHEEAGTKSTRGLIWLCGLARKPSDQGCRPAQISRAGIDTVRLLIFCEESCHQRVPLGTILTLFCG